MWHQKHWGCAQSALRYLLQTNQHSLCSKELCDNLLNPIVPSMNPSYLKYVISEVFHILKRTVSLEHIPPWPSLNVLYKMYWYTYGCIATIKWQLPFKIHPNTKLAISNMQEKKARLFSSWAPLYLWLHRSQVLPISSCKRARSLA